jgi:hypothetical protein
MTGQTNPAGSLGFAFTNAGSLSPEQISSTLAASGVNAGHTGKDYQVSISVPTTEQPVLDGDPASNEPDPALVAYAGAFRTLKMAVEMGSEVHEKTRLAELERRLAALPLQNPELHAKYQNL